MNLDEQIKLAENLVDKYAGGLTISEESAYHIHFRRLMKKHNISKLSAASKEAKTKLFRDVKSTWSALKYRFKKPKTVKEDLDLSYFKEKFSEIKNSNLSDIRKKELIEQFKIHLSKLFSKKI